MYHTEIAYITPDEDLYDLVNELKSKFSEPILVKKSFLDEAVQVGVDLEREGISVIVSRGGTTDMLRNSKISIPIIDIPITEYDVIGILDQARRISSKFAIIGFDTLINGIESIAPIWNVEIKKFLVKNQKEVKKAVKEAKDLGITVVVGGQATVDYANELGEMKAILIKSKKPAVLSSIKEAIRVLEALRKEREMGQRLTSLLDSIHEGIISVDKAGRITHFNDYLVKIMNLENKIAVGSFIDEILGDKSIIPSINNGQKWVDEIRTIKGVAFICDLTPIYINKENLGAIISFRVLEEIQKLEHNVRRKLYQKGHVAKYRFTDIIRRPNLSLEKLIEKANSYAKVDSTILIYGESGTGKELFAQSLHNESSCKNGPFVAINCAALPENLLESELFGYVEGAFTGARKGGKPGLFEIAHGGTLFLDEIGEISPFVQARLLRALEERQIMRIGDDKVIPVDVRIICATNKNLRKMVSDNIFREDLFYRINILRLEMPPLRERIEDIDLLVQYFLETFGLKLNKKSLLIDGESMQVLRNYKWPGNIRELKNVIERLVISSNKDKGSITFSDVIDILDEGFEMRKTSPKHHFGSKTSILYEEEMKLISKVLEETGGNKAETARRLGISKTTLWRKLK